MARNRVKLVYIANDAVRKASHNKRKKGLLKKVNELSTLCGVDACAVIYSSTCNSQPEAWPSTATAHRMLFDFKALPVAEQSNRTMTQESLIKQRIAKAEGLKKVHEENRRMELTQIMFQILNGRVLNTVKKEDLNDLSRLIEQNLNGIYIRLQILNESYVL
ncbi:hypothetical protein V6N13_139679 [Hibiscus sabdariffa]|uniref:MADS-box domain-containing protein n=2 Tax=Hibiscus sabdariffa TaxID=183260 RepID=A0ABR1ZZK2_9ROSI